MFALSIYKNEANSEHKKLYWFLNTDCTSPELIGNGYCNDETNSEDCNHDGGDCCVNVNKDVCSDCECISGGVITSPGFPETYYNNLDLTWLIEVPAGQRIQIRFLKFDVENCSSACL